MARMAVSDAVNARRKQEREERERRAEAEARALKATMERGPPAGQNAPKLTPLQERLFVALFERATLHTFSTGVHLLFLTSLTYSWTAGGAGAAPVAPTLAGLPLGGSGASSIDV